MANVSRPLIVLLVGTVAFFALWLFALKPSPSSPGGSQALGTYQSAINAAHNAVAKSNAVSAAHGGNVGTTPATAAASASSASAANRAASAAGSTRVTPATRHRLDVVSRTLVANKVLALLFFNPSGADDQAVELELASVPSHGQKVVKLAVPLNELTRYSVVTNQVPLTVSPTLVLIDPDQQASTIVGFADRFEISQRVADALRVP